MSNEIEIKIFSGTSNISFAEKICRHLNVQMGKSEVHRFSEGNIYVKIGERVRDKDVYIIQTIGLDPNNEFMELLFWIDAFKRSSANSITAIMPYFSYAKADKKDEPRVSIRARVCADCLESAGVDRIITMDLHSPQIQGFFKKPVDHLYVAKLFCNYIKDMNLDNYLIVSPDEGFAKRARFYSQYLHVPLAIGSKQRQSHDEKAEIMDIIGDVKGKNAIIVDDFTITCGTLAEMARTLKEKGAKKIYAFASHGVLIDKSLEALENSYIEKLVLTDTVYNPLLQHKQSKIEILSVSSLFAEAIRIIHNKESLGELFEI